MSRPVKRSFTLDGHRTSISLEATFWDALQEIAGAEGIALAALVQRIDRARAKSGADVTPTTDGRSTSDIGLSGAIRVHLLAHFRALAKRPE